MTEERGYDFDDRTLSRFTLSYPKGKEWEKLINEGMIYSKKSFENAIVHKTDLFSEKYYKLESAVPPYAELRLRSKDKSITNIDAIHHIQKNQPQISIREKVWMGTCVDLEIREETGTKILTGLFMPVTITEVLGYGFYKVQVTHPRNKSNSYGTHTFSYDHYIEGNFFSPSFLKLNYGRQNIPKANDNTKMKKTAIIQINKVRYLFMYKNLFERGG